MRDQQQRGFIIPVCVYKRFNNLEGDRPKQLIIVKYCSPYSWCYDTHNMARNACSLNNVLSWFSQWAFKPDFRQHQAANFIKSLSVYPFMHLMICPGFPSCPTAHYDDILPGRNLFDPTSPQPLCHSVWLWESCEHPSTAIQPVPNLQPLLLDPRGPQQPQPPHPLILLITQADPQTPIQSTHSFSSS